MKYINTLDKYYLAENSLASSSTKYDHCIRAILPTNSHIMNKQNCLHQKKSIIEVLWTSLKTPWIGIKCLKISVKTTRIGIGPKTCGFFLSLPTKFDESIYRTFCSRIQCGLCAQTVVLKIYASCLTPKKSRIQISVAREWSPWANFAIVWVTFFWMIYIKFIMPIFGEEYSEGSQEWTFSIKKEIYCKNFSLLILPTKAFRRFLPKLCAFSPRHQWLGILVIPTHINSQSPVNAINPINLATNTF